MSSPIKIELTINTDKHEKSIQLRVIEIENGYLIRGGSRPVHFSEIEDAAESVKVSLISAFKNAGKAK